MLDVAGLEAGYGDGKVLFGVDLAVASGEVVTLLGRNGMGKTTTLSAIMGILRAEGGTIRLDGAPIQHLPAYRIARLGLGLVPEGRQIFPNLTVRENLVATAAQRMAAPGQWDLDSVLGLFPGLRERRGHLGGLLSGGEQQMLAIGRALLGNPRLLVMDEPTEGLAPIIVDQLVETLTRIGKEEDMSVLLVEHDMDVVFALADRITVMVYGRVIATGAPAAIRADAEVRRAYLGADDS